MSAKKFMWLVIIPFIFIVLIIVLFLILACKPNLGAALKMDFGRFVYNFVERLSLTCSTNQQNKVSNNTDYENNTKIAYNEQLFKLEIFGNEKRYTLGPWGPVRLDILVTNPKLERYWFETQWVSPQGKIFDLKRNECLTQECLNKTQILNYHSYVPRKKPGTWIFSVTGLKYNSNSEEEPISAISQFMIN